MNCTNHAAFIFSVCPMHKCIIHLKIKKHLKHHSQLISLLKELTRQEDGKWLFHCFISTFLTVSMHFILIIDLMFPFTGFILFWWFQQHCLINPPSRISLLMDWFLLRKLFSCSVVLIALLKNLDFWWFSSSYLFAPVPSFNSTNTCL